MNPDLHATLILIGGPTASGKSALAMDFARHFNTEIISADSRQCFKEMSIGTAKPEARDLEEIKHHFINSHSIHDHFSAGIFANESAKILNSLFSTHHYVVAVGGTGMYLKALTDGLDELPTVDDSIREKVKLLFKEKGITPLLELISTKDPEFFEKVDQNNPSRLMRAAEIILHTNQKYSSFLGKAKKQFPYKTIKLVICPAREKLYANIDSRVDKMMEMGLLEEVKSLVQFQNLTTLHTVGYNELFDYFNGKTNLAFALDKIKQHSRNYAKRQITWFKNQGDYTFLDPAKINITASELSKDW